MKYVIKKYLFIGIIFISASCSPIVENRGYVFDEKLLDQIKVNETISNDVMDILGSPSTTSAIDASTWYYIYSKAETVAFYRPTVTDRRVLAVSFGDDNKVDNLIGIRFRNNRICKNKFDKKTFKKPKKINCLFIKYKYFVDCD